MANEAEAEVDWGEEDLDDLTPEQRAELNEALQELDDAMSADVVDDISAAFAEDSYTWEIPTGKFSDDGRPLALRVRVKDPMQADLPIRYMQARQRKGGEEKATLALFQACITSPMGLKNPANFAKLTSAFKATITYRLLGLIGVNGDFFAALQTMGSQTARRPAAKSTTPSPTSTAGTPTKSPSGQQTSSGTPTSSPNSDDSSNEKSSSKTSPTSLPKPSEGKMLSQSSTLLKKSTEEATNPTPLTVSPNPSGP